MKLVLLKILDQVIHKLNSLFVLSAIKDVFAEIYHTEIYSVR